MIVDPVNAGWSQIPSPSLGLLQGPDNPLSDLLGYVVVFMVVVWPIIRGVMESAQQKRQEFERGQARKAKANARSGGPARRRSLEEIMRGDPYVETLAEPTGPGAQNLSSGDLSVEDLRQRALGSGSDGAMAPQLERQRDPSLYGSRTEDANPTLRPSEVELVGDPFDDSIMGQDLVSQDSLKEVPSEDELETSIASVTEGGRHALGSKAAPAGSSDRLGAPTSALARLESRLTPWQRAFVYREVLGPPAAMNSHNPGEN